MAFSGNHLTCKIFGLPLLSRCEFLRKYGKSPYFSIVRYSQTHSGTVRFHQFFSKYYGLLEERSVVIAFGNLAIDLHYFVPSPRLLESLHFVDLVQAL